MPKLVNKQKKVRTWQCPKTDAGLTREHLRIKRELKKKTRIMSVYAHAEKILEFGVTPIQLAEFLDFHEDTVLNYIEDWEDMNLVEYRNEKYFKA